MMMVATQVQVRPEVLAWLESKGLKPDMRYGTVRMVKAVQSDGRSKHEGRHGRLAYEPGTTVVAPDYQPTPSCGQGLHFSENASQARNFSGGAGRMLVVDVDLESAVLVEGNKIKARFCHVRFDGNETDFGRFST